MAGFSDNETLILNMRSGTAEDPFVEIEESHKIISNKVLLSEVPYSLKKVRVTGDGVTWTETRKISDVNSNSNMFYVDYNTGVVTFNPSREGRTLTFQYWGRGSIYMSADRIWSQRNGNIIEKSLQDEIDEINDLKDIMNDNEKDRKSNESSRISSENTRRYNEDIRQSQESSRQANTQAAIERLDSAVNSHDEHTLIIYKNSVSTYSNISSTYPNPSNGWLVLVEDTGKKYRYSGSEKKWMYVGDASGMVAQPNPPSDTTLTWIDTSE